MSTENKEIVAIPAYLKKLSEYIILGPHGIIPLNYVVEIDLVKDQAVIERIRNDPQFAERFHVSAVTPMKVEDLGKMKTGKIAVTIRARE
jgi:hypothetical protein